MVAPWVWAVAAGALGGALAARGMLGRGSFSTRQALGWIAVYVSLAVLFGLALGVTAGWVTAGQFYTGYLTEYSLSLDNLFVFSVIMGWFAVPAARQPRLLLFGIGAAVVLRSALIVAGAAALNRFGWLFYPLGAVLVWTAIGLIKGSGNQPDSDPERHARLAGWLRRHVQKSGRQGTTPVFLLAVAIGLADLLFAFDSIPAVFGITTNALLVVACNVFALRGLRQLAGLLARRLCETFGHTPDSAAGRAGATAQSALFDTMLSHLDANRDHEISRQEFVTGVGPGLADRPEFDAGVGRTPRSLTQGAGPD